MADYQGGVLAASHFLAYGHKNFAFVCESLKQSPVIRQRLRGFSETLERAGFPLPKDHVLDGLSPEELKEALKRLRQEHLAIFTYSDMYSQRIIQTIAELGFSIPEDFSLIGFDNMDYCSLFSPPLTSIAQDLPEKARMTVEFLMRQLDYPELPREKLTLPVRLIERESVRRFQ